MHVSSRQIVCIRKAAGRLERLEQINTFQVGVSIWLVIFLIGLCLWGTAKLLSFWTWESVTNRLTDYFRLAGHILSIFGKLWESVVITVRPLLESVLSDVGATVLGWACLVR